MKWQDRTQGGLPRLTAWLAPSALYGIEGRPIPFEHDVRVDALLIGKENLVAVVHPGVAVQIAQLEGLTRGGIPKPFHASGGVAELPEHVVLTPLLVLVPLPADVGEILGGLCVDGHAVANSFLFNGLQGGRLLVDAALPSWIDPDGGD